MPTNATQIPLVHCSLQGLGGKHTLLSLSSLPHVRQDRQQVERVSICVFLTTEVAPTHEKVVTTLAGKQ